MSTQPSIPNYGRAIHVIEAFAISKTTLWRWSKKPSFPEPRKVGGLVLYDLNAICDWIEKHGEAVHTNSMVQECTITSPCSEVQKNGSERAFYVERTGKLSFNTIYVD